MNHILEIDESLRKLLRERIQEVQNENTRFADAVIEHGKQMQDIVLLQMVVDHTQIQKETHQKYQAAIEELNRKLQ